MVTSTTTTPQTLPTNYLCDEGQLPDKTTAEMYTFDKQIKTDFSYIEGAESHLRRRKMILKKYPEIAKLLEVDKPYSIILAIFVISLGLTVTYLVKDASWPVYLSVLYIVGGTYGHTLHCLIHDFIHFGGHKNMNVNRMMAIMCNIPQGIPSALPFGKYHADHHNYLGEEGLDPDLPTKAESTASAYIFFKWFFWGLMTLFYAFRPVFCYNRKITTDEIINVIVIACTDFIIWKFWGPSALFFLFGVALFSIGGHPGAIHVLAEHFEFAQGLETYDYIGPWNILNIDLGYHIEHHDFPTAPWWNLRKIRKAAPEFYENLPVHTSYTKVLLKFLCDKNFSLFNRTIRINKKE